MSEDGPPVPGSGEPATTGGEPVPRRDQAARPGYWFPLLLFGLLALVPWQFSGWLTPASGISAAPLTRVTFWSPAQAVYLGIGPDAGPFALPRGWYWTVALIAGFLLSSGWYRRHDRRAGTRTPTRGYLAAGLTLTVLAAALPLLATGAPAQAVWLGDQWNAGTFALVTIAVSLWMLALAERSPALGIIAAVNTADALLITWSNVRDPLPAFLLPPAPGPVLLPGVVLPAAVLLLAGIGALAIPRRPRAARSS